MNARDESPSATPPDASARYRISSVPDLTETESVAVVMALVQLGELAAPVAPRQVQPTSAAGRRRAARFHDVWPVAP